MRSLAAIIVVGVHPDLLQTTLGRQAQSVSEERPVLLAALTPYSLWIEADEARLALPFVEVGEDR